MHHAGEGGDYTARRRPLRVAYIEEFLTLHEAFLAERQVKGWSRAKKEALIRRDYDALPELSRNHQAKKEVCGLTGRWTCFDKLNMPLRKCC